MLGVGNWIDETQTAWGSSRSDQITSEVIGLVVGEHQHLSVELHLKRGLTSEKTAVVLSSNYKRTVNDMAMCIVNFYVSRCAAMRWLNWRHMFIRWELWPKTGSRLDTCYEVVAWSLIADRWTTTVRWWLNWWLASTNRLRRMWWLFDFRHCAKAVCSWHLLVRSVNER